MRPRRPHRIAAITLALLAQALSLLIQAGGIVTCHSREAPPCAGQVEVTLICGDHADADDDDWSPGLSPCARCEIGDPDGAVHRPVTAGFAGKRSDRITPLPHACSIAALVSQTGAVRLPASRLAPRHALKRHLPEILPHLLRL